MTSPYLLGPPYYDSHDGYYIDPNLQSPDHQASFDHWGLQDYLKDQQRPLFHSSVAPGVNQNRSCYPPPAVSGPASHYRLPSPISSIEQSSASGTAHSPLADSDSYHDPSTPPEAFSPYSRGAHPFHFSADAHALLFGTMGPQVCVNPAEVNSDQQPDPSESDGENITFDLMPARTPSWDRCSASQYDVEPSYPRLAKPMAGLDDDAAPVKDEVKVASQYPPPPVSQDLESDEGASVPRPRKRNLKSDDAWEPEKRTKTGGARSPPRPRAKPKPSPRQDSRIRPMPDAQRPPAPPQPLQSTRPIPPPRTGQKVPFYCREPGCPKPHFADQSALEKHVKKEHRRGYICVFHFAGCESTFASKNEWKRHVSSQHLLLHYWLCEEDGCADTCNGTDPIPTNSSAAKSAPSQFQHQRSKSIAGGTKKNIPNGAIFNRKDLYTQHMRRMHMPEGVKKKLPASANKKSLTTAGTSGAAVEQWDDQLRRFQEKAIRSRCSLPEYMTCPAEGCGTEFRGTEAWDQRMEHVARHLDRATHGGEPQVVFGGPGDPCLTNWAGSPDVGIIEPFGSGWRLKAPASSRGRGVERRGRPDRARVDRALMREKGVQDEIIVGSEEDAEGDVDYDV